MFAAILTCGSTTVLTSCSDDEVEDFVEAVNLVGTWKGTIISLTPAPSSRLEFEMDGSVTFNANGTFVNHLQVEQAELADGDLITMGDTTLRFVRTKA